VLTPPALQIGGKQYVVAVLAGQIAIGENQISTAGSRIGWAVVVPGDAVPLSFIYGVATKGSQTFFSGGKSLRASGAMGG
jgi:hypothetical protein